MSEQSKVSDHLRQCTEILKEEMGEGILRRMPGPTRKAFEAIFELVEADWNDMPEDMMRWRQGYEQCMIDIIDAVADEWLVSLPKAPIPGE